MPVRNRARIGRKNNGKIFRENYLEHTFAWGCEPVGRFEGKQERCYQRSCKFILRRIIRRAEWRERYAFCLASMQKGSMQSLSMQSVERKAAQ